MVLTLRQAKKREQLNGYEVSQTIPFSDFGQYVELSPQSLKRRRWAAGILLGILAVGAGFVDYVVFRDTNLLPRFSNGRDVSIDNLSAQEQVDDCRFNRTPCLRVEGLVAVKTDGNNTGPAISNPVVVRDHGVIKIVSDNVAPGPNQANFMIWDLNDSVTLCSGEEPLVGRLGPLGYQNMTSKFEVANTGEYSPRLDPFNANCQQQVNPLSLAMLLDQTTAVRQPA